MERLTESFKMDYFVPSSVIGIGAGVLQSNEDVEVFLVSAKSHPMETERKESTIKIGVNSIL